MVQLALYALINYESQLFCKPFCLVSIVFSPFLFWDISHAQVLNANGLISQDKGNIFVPSNYLYYQSNLVVRDAKKCKPINCKSCVASYAFLHVRFLIFIDCCGFISVVSFPPSGLKIQTSLMSFATRDKNSGQSTKMSVSCCVDSVAFCDSKLFLKGFMHNELLILGIIYQ